MVSLNPTVEFYLQGTEKRPSFFSSTTMPVSKKKKKIDTV
jgi:hypothetical protein